MEVIDFSKTSVYYGATSQKIGLFIVIVLRTSIARDNCA
jgi:hypothetical protein